MEKGKVSTTAWAVAGFASFGLGAVGTVIPILPTTPFLLVTAFCFARSSRKLNKWFRGTRLYREVLEGYVSKRAMTPAAKLKVIIPVTIVLGVSFALMASAPVGRAVIGAVWLAHLVYFGLIVKTDRGSLANAA